MTGPMEGLRVIDLTEGYVGYCGTMLAEFGSSVIKVEPPEGDSLRALGPPFVSEDSAAFLGVNRGKQSVVLPWKEDAEARQILMRLINRADVLVSSLYPDEAESLRVDYESVTTSNPTIIYCSITPFGDEGPLKNKRATELEVQGMSGQWRLVGAAGEPPIRMGVPIGAIGGAVFGFQGIAGAMVHRLKTGQGQKVSVSQMGAILSMRTITWAAESEPDDWIGHCVAPYRPPARGSKTKDRAVLWGFFGDKEGEEKFLKEIGLGHMKNDPRVLSGGDTGPWNNPDMKAIFEDAVKDKTADEVVALVRKHGGSAVPYHTSETLSRDPQAQAMNMPATFNHPAGRELRTIGAPWGFSETAPKIGTPPLLGQHTRKVLEELGLTTAELSRLAKAGLIRGS